MTTESIFDFACGRSDELHDHPLTEAARVALEANPTPRMLKLIVDHDGTPIEIPEAQPLPKSEE